MLFPPCSSNHPPPKTFLALPFSCLACHPDDRASSDYRPLVTKPTDLTRYHTVVRNLGVTHRWMWRRGSPLSSLLFLLPLLQSWSQICLKSLVLCCLPRPFTLGEHLRARNVYLVKQRRVLWHTLRVVTEN